MTAVNATGNFGKEVTEALGLGNEIKEIHIHIVAGDMVLVEVLKYMSPEEGKALTEILKKYELHEKEEIDYDALVDQWHDPDTVTDLPLYEYLGMTKKQYERWLKNK